ncbi:MAG: response regulator [Gemmatimonadaceae bacterium]|nr:response regulator [Chitinophagaceae bacterium]
MHYLIIVCDDEGDAASVVKAFEKQSRKIQMTIFSSARLLTDFLETKQEAEYPALVIIDYYLPGMSSLDLVVSMRKKKEYRLIPLAVMAGFATQDVIGNYYKEGANCFYRKPVDDDDWSHMADCLLTLFFN